MAQLIPLEGYLDQIGVPRVFVNRLERFADLLLAWNEKMNLVAESTLPDMWRRHFWDSAQLFPLIPAGARRVVDLGSGAGFPGLVLAVLGAPDVHLIESTGKKADFLRTVVADLGLAVTVHQERAENIKNLAADVVTARAVAALPELLSFAQPFWKKDTLGLFLKGEKVEAELTQAHKYWTFTLEKTPSLTASTGVVLKIKNLKKQDFHDRKRPFTW